MKRTLTLLSLTAACLLVPAIASAHPLGNFTINRYAGIRVQPDRVLVHYVVDMAEIPTFQERASVAGNPEAYAARTCARIVGDLALNVDGRAIALRAASTSATFPAGAAGLPTTRLTCDLSGAIPAYRSAREIRFRDDAFSGRLGWREITAVGDRTTLAASSVPARSVSAELTRYPSDLLSSPLDVRTASIRFTSGGTAAAAERSGVVGSLLPRGIDRATQAFQSLLANRSVTVPLAAVALALAILLGALHALAPGHGKTVMAAYLVGQRGTVRQGILMGLTVTATHTAGVLALGLLVTASTTVAPERLYPLFGVASGLMLAAIGASLLRRALHARRTHDHAHGHDHVEAFGTRRLLALGFAGGLVPSPSAVVVLLGALAIGHVWLGVALVFAYGIGMAATLSGAGLLLVRVRRYAEARAANRRTRPRLALLSRVVPVLTASVITAVGLSLAARGALAM